MLKQNHAVVEGSKLEIDVGRVVAFAKAILGEALADCRRVWFSNLRVFA